MRVDGQSAHGMVAHLHVERGARLGERCGTCQIETHARKGDGFTAANYKITSSREAEKPSSPLTWSRGANKHRAMCHHGEKCLNPDSNRRPPVCETGVITNYTIQTWLRSKDRHIGNHPDVFSCRNWLACLCRCRDHRYVLLEILPLYFLER